MKKQKGFTLVELLVVISIIAVLSSIVFSSLQATKAKAKVAAVKQGVRELSQLMYLEYQETGSYINLQNFTWIPSGGTCASTFTTGNYAAQAVAICNSIVKNTVSGFGDDYSFLTATISGGGKFSIMASTRR